MEHMVSLCVVRHSGHLKGYTSKMKANAEGVAVRNKE